MKLALPRARSASRIVPCDASLAWDILTEYSTWAEWLPLVTRCTEVARESNFARVDLELAVYPGRTVSAECAHAPGSRVLIKSMIGEDPEFVLDWTIAAAGSGQTTVTVTCTWIHTPANFKAASGGLNVERWLAAFAGQVESFAGDFTAAPADSSTIFEVYETEDGLVCWFRGKKYEMKAVS